MSKTVGFIWNINLPENGESNDFYLCLSNINTTIDGHWVAIGQNQTVYKKETIQWPIVAVANRKNYVSIYVCAVQNGEYVAEKMQQALGKVSVGKSCIRVKKLADINLDALKEVLLLAAKYPGLR